MLTGFVIGDRGLGASGDTHPSWMMAHAEVGSYIIIGASAAGQIHLARKLPRDDAFIIRSVGPWVAVAVSDGVGSRPLSRYGATYVAESLTTLLLRKLAPPAKLAKNKLDIESTSSGHAPTIIKEDVELQNLAPPPTTEEAELKPWFRFSSLDQSRMGTNPNLPPFREIPPKELRQVSSIGWWPSLDLIDSLTHLDEAPDAKSPSPQFQMPMNTIVPDQNAVSNTTMNTQNLPDLNEIMNQAFYNTHRGLAQHAASLEVEITDLSCTALALLLNVETGQGVVGQIGDGAVLGLSADGKVEEMISPPDTGDPQSTYTISRSNYSKYLAVSSIESRPDNPYVATYMMTDGLSGDLLFSPRHDEIENWAKGVNATLQKSPSPTRAAAGMLNWLATYQVKGSWDDRTLVVIMQRVRSDGNSQPVTGQSEPAQSTDDR